MEPHDERATDTSDSDAQLNFTHPSASDEARDLALAIVAAGLSRKASGIEIIDVCGKVDYTGRIKEVV